jgi:hypothetical protein
MEDQAVILGNKAYSLDVWTEDGDVIGFIGWWDCGEWRFVEHYAINTPYRSLGYGSRLLSGWMKQSQLPVLLEIEPVVDGLTLRRQRFYHRLGFVDNISVKHRQPPYHKGDAPLDLWLMSYPCKITDTAYERFYFMQKTEIMPQF